MSHRPWQMAKRLACTSLRPGDLPELDAFLTRLTNGVDDNVGGGWRIGSGFGFASDAETTRL